MQSPEHSNTRVNDTLNTGLMSRPSQTRVPPSGLGQPTRLLAVNSDDDWWDDLRGHPSAVTALTCSYDGDRVASGSEDGSVIVWGAFKRQTMRGRWQADSTAVHALAFSPDGERIACAHESGCVKVWSVSGRLLQSLATVRWPEVLCPAKSLEVIRESEDTPGPTRSLETVAEQKHPPGPAQLYTLTRDHPGSGRERALSKNSAAPRRMCVLAWLSDGTRIAAVLDTTVYVWDSATFALVSQRPLKIDHSSITFAVFSRDALLLAYGGGGLGYIWDVDGGKLQATLKGHDASEDSHATQTRKESDEEKGARRTLLHAAFDAEEERIVTCSDDHTVRVWDIRTGTMLRSWSDWEPARSAAFSPDGARVLIAPAYPSTVPREWDLGLPYVGRRGWRPLDNYTGAVSRACVSPDGRYCASASAHDRAVHLWRLHRQERNAPSLVEMCRRHKDVVTLAMFCRDGQVLVSAAKDGTVYFHPGWCPRC